jgi:hypothetical protein
MCCLPILYTAYEAKIIGMDTELVVNLYLIH